MIKFIVCATERDYDVPLVVYYLLLLLGWQLSTPL